MIIKIIRVSMLIILLIVSYLYIFNYRKSIIRIITVLILLAVMALLIKI